MLTTRHISNWKHIASLSAPGLLEEVFKMGTVTGKKDDEIISLTVEQFESLLKKYNSKYVQPERKKFPEMEQFLFQKAVNKTEASLPSFLTMAKNAGKAFARATKAVLTGEQVLRSETDIDRIGRICAQCEFLRSDGRCGKCGCSITNWINKLQFATEKCPVGKW